MLVEQYPITQANDTAGQPASAAASPPEMAAMLDEYEPQLPRRGDVVEGEILILEEKEALIDVGAKRDAVVPPQEMRLIAEELLDDLDEGDTIPVYVLKTPDGDHELLVSVERGLEEEDWRRAEALIDSKEVLELAVSGHNKGGLLVDFGRLQGFVPNSHVPVLQDRASNAQDRTQAKIGLVGDELPVQVLEVDRRRQRLVMSAKAAHGARVEARLNELNEGQVVDGTVVSVVDFGAFVDIGDATGLLHASQMAHHRVEDPEEVVAEGDNLKVVVREIDHDRQRVSLTRKPLLRSPWQEFAGSHSEGDLIDGEVVAIVDFGAFIRLSQGIDGLIHISEMGPDFYGHASEVLNTGDRVLTRIVSIDADDERIGLSMRRVSADEESAWLMSRHEEAAPAE